MVKMYQDVMVKCVLELRVMVERYVFTWTAKVEYTATQFFRTERKERHRMCDILNGFWEWAGISPEYYANESTECLNGSPEYYYPQFDQLIEYAQNIIRHDSMSKENVDDLLTIMALDNEAEDVLDYLSSHASQEQIERIAFCGKNHIQPNARWQIAELVY